MDPFNRNPPQTGFNQQYLPPQYMNSSQMMQMQRFPQQNNFQFQNAPYNQAHMLYGNQRFISPNQQAMNTQPPMQQNHQPRPSAVPHKVNPEEEKKQRYKLEQQRKFRDFGSNFGRTTIDTMLNNIVTSSSNQQSKTQTQKFHIEDDFGDFLQANQPNTSDVPVPTPIATTNDDFAEFSPVIPPVCISPATSTKIVPVTTQPSSTTENHLQSKMLASLDLNQSKQANHNFRSVHAPASKRPENKIVPVSTKAADWSALSVNEEEFQVVLPPVVEKPAPDGAKESPTPSWMSDLNQVPLIYKQVLEASIGSDGMLDTNKVYPILLRSQLSNETLGHLWSQANRMVPGRLNQEELFTLLALIAVTQAGESAATVEMVRSIPTPPIPSFDTAPPPLVTTNPHLTHTGPGESPNTFYSAQQTAPPAMDPMLNNLTGVSINLPQVPSIAPDIHPHPPPGHIPPTLPSANPMEVYQSSLPGVPPKLPQTHSQVMNNSNPPDDDDFDDFQEFQSVTSTVLPNPNATSDTARVNSVFGNTLQTTRLNFSGTLKNEDQLNTAFTPNKLKGVDSDPALIPPPLGLTDDKYSAFNDLNKPSTFDPSIEDHADHEAPTYSSLFARDPELFSNSPNPPSGENASDDFGDFSEAKVEWKSLFTDNLAAQKKLHSSSHFSNDLKMFNGKHNNNHLENINKLETEAADKYAAFSDTNFTMKFDNISTKSDENSVKSIDIGSVASKLKSDSNSVLSLDLKSTARLGARTVDSEANSVKSLDFTKISDTIMQQSIGSSVPHVPPATNTSVNVDLYDDDDDFGDFCEPPPDLPSDMNDEFDVYNGGNSALVDFDPFESPPPQSKNQVKPPQPDQVFPLSPTFRKKVEEINSPVSSPTRKQDDDAAILNDFKNFPDNQVLNKEEEQSNTNSDVTNNNKANSNDHNNPASFNHSDTQPASKNLGLKDPEYFLKHSLFSPETTIPSSQPHEDENKVHPTSPSNHGVEKDVEKPRFDASVWSNGHDVQRNVVEGVFDDNSETLDVGETEWKLTTQQVDHVKVYSEKWQLCLDACLDVISTTNELLSTIASPVVCNEVVYSCKGQRFISDLAAVYEVARRIASSARKINLDVSEIQQLHKQIELSWNNILSFCPNVHVNDLEVVTKGDGALVCGVCLLAMKGSQIDYAGATYHATCANLWVNRVAPVLPALQPPQPEM